MYHGSVFLMEKRYTDSWRPAWGWQPQQVGVERVIRHRYTCDACGRAYQFLEPAEVPFYCGGTDYRAQVGITPATP